MGSDPAALVTAAQAGDTVAMAELLDVLSPYVARICGPIALGSGADAAQDTLVAVLRSLGSLRQPGALFGWVRAIAVRESLRHASADAQALPRSPDLLANVPARDDPQLAADVRAVLRRLRPEHRAVLVLRDLEGLDEQTTAAVLAVPKGTLKSRLHRARAAFRKEWTI
jgi:RNA polymerase sigma-70 factor (ECF subfamily)